MPSLRFVIGALVLLLLFYGLANAQTTRPAAGHGEGLKRLTAALDQVDLTPDQKQQVDAIKQEMAEAVRDAAPSLKGLSPDERREKLQSTLAPFREKFKEVLTPEQQKQVRQNLQAGAGAKADAKPSGHNPLADLKTENKADGDPPLVVRLRAELNKLDLTPEQKTKTDAVCDDTAKQVQELRKDAATNPDATREKVGPILQSVRTKLAAILTEDQKQKLADAMPRMGGKADGRAGKRRRDNDDTAPATQPTHASAANAAAASSATPAVTAGQPAPAFTLSRLNGSSATNKTYVDKALVLVFASYTSPSLRDRLPALQTLAAHNRYKANVVLVYTREAHPADGWQVGRNTDEHIEINQPQTAPARLAAAKQLASGTKTTLDVLVDGIDDATAAAYGASSDTAVVISPHGTVVGRQQWCDPSGIQRMIDDAPKTDAKASGG